MSADTPGAMAHTVSRNVPGGLVEFETAPVGWLTKGGEARRKPWRAYHWTPDDGKRTRLPSVTTILDQIMPKPGLPPWAEARGIEGAIMAVRDGLLDPLTVDDPVRAVRSLKLGADAARDEAADRGLSLHALLEAYMLYGEVPSPMEHPVEQRGYVQALAKWLARTSPEPHAVEQLVCSPEDGYAGRLDLVATIGGYRSLVDLKTNEGAKIFAQAHVQAGLYAKACVACGDDPPDRAMVIVLAADGEYREMPCAADESACEMALQWWRALRPIESACESANRAQRKARLEAAA